MTKAELVAIIAEKNDLSVATVKTVVNAFIKEVPIQMEKGHEIQIRGFGTFKTVVRKPKRVRDIGRKTSFTLPARKEKIFRFMEKVR